MEDLKHVSIVIAGELGLDLDLIRRSGFRVVRQGGAELVRDFFRFFDDDPASEARYLVLWGDVDLDHLVNPAQLHRALAYLVCAHGGRLFIPRGAWERLDYQKVHISVHDLGVTVSAPG
ncbi:MAG TPA: hypothetical protein VF173_16735 [Thermoanaerobaculia bacterium]|nr:hypothetical protein [Thermoanaerobaculia bacterium]